MGITNIPLSKSQNFLKIIKRLESLLKSEQSKQTVCRVRRKSVDSDTSRPHLENSLKISSTDWLGNSKMERGMQNECLVCLEVRLKFYRLILAS